MAFNYEFERHIQAAKAAQDVDAVAALEAQRTQFSLLVKAKIIKELPRESQTESSAPVAKEAQTPRPDLRQQTYELLSRVVEPTDKEKRELREKRGLVFLPMTRQSYAQLVAGDKKHFWDRELEYANARPALRDFVPPVAVEVGLIEAQLALPGSFRKPRLSALQMIEDYSQELLAEFPGFRAIMLPVTGYASADQEYSKRNPGQVLFKNFFAWGLDDLPGSVAANGGRDHPDNRFYVNDWYADDGSGGVGAVPAVVKIGVR